MPSLSPSPKPPRRRQTLAELIRLQRLTGTAIMRPLGSDFDAQKRWIDGQDMEKIAARFIKPNDRLTSFERLAIYNRQYWFRLIDCFYDDFPGLRAVLGADKFSLLSRAYLAKYPSRSFALRNLGYRLVQFLEEEPNHARPRRRLALDMARFEWAQIESFDNAALPPLSVDDLLGKDPNRLRLRLQPHIGLLELNYPLDDYVIALKKEMSARTEAGVSENDAESAHAKPRRTPARRKTFLAVHRHDNILYYKRLEEPAYRILCRLRDGATLSAACAGVGRVSAQQISEWFRSWTSLGWFCSRSIKKAALRARR